MAVVVLATAGRAPSARAQEAVGVNPADNLTKFEVLPKLTVIDDAGGVSNAALTLRFDQAIKGVFGINIELPLLRFESPGGSANGIGDLSVRGRAQASLGRFVVIGGVETVLPVATDAALGTGKVQLNPVAVLVYGFSRSVFAAAVAKHFLSVAGDENRADIRQGQYRMIVAYSSPKGWWVLLDPQLWVDYAAERGSELALELEAGTMLGRTTAVWLRGGGHVSGSWQRQDWSVGGGVRFIRF